MESRQRVGGWHWNIWLLGVATVLAVFVACSYLPGPLDIILPVIYAVGLGGALRRNGRAS